MSKIYRPLPIAALLSSVFIAQPALATVVLVKTSLGNFEVNLYDQSTPVTVTNFLSYVKAGSYNGTFIHRSEPGFVIQGGGFKYSGNNAAPFSAVAQQAPIRNEPKWSNVRATIAMAKVAGDPNSATNQWFINLADNSGGNPQLDLQNAGFTVFGQVTGTGMEVIDAIAALPNKLNASFNGVPLRNYTSADATAQRAVTQDNLVLIESISVVNSEVNSAASLNPKANTAILQQQNSGGSSSGGAFGFVLLGFTALLGLARRR